MRSGSRDSRARRVCPDRGSGTSGFTLIELMLVVAILGTLASIGLTNYGTFVAKARAVQAISDIKNASTMIKEHQLSNEQLPATLAAAGVQQLTDPWGNPYQYLVLADANKGAARKDRFLTPLNSQFDLYSMGPDGKSVAPLTAKASRDDVIWAADGSYIGVAAHF